MTKNDKKIRLLYLLELQIFDNQKLAITASEFSRYMLLEKATPAQRQFLL